jgi:hypothetical protein
MGKHLFVVTLISLFMLLWIDVFKSWYTKFLAQRGISSKSINTLMRILWVILTMVFWYTLLHRGMPEEFSITHFSFALFVFSFYNLFRSFFRKAPQEHNK